MHVHICVRQGGAGLTSVYPHRVRDKARARAATAGPKDATTPLSLVPVTLERERRAGRSVGGLKGQARGAGECKGGEGGLCGMV